MVFPNSEAALSTDTEIAVLRRDVEALTKQVSELTNSIKDLRDAWMAAGKFVGLVKWAAGLSASVMAAWAAFTKLKGVS